MPLQSKQQPPYYNTTSQISGGTSQVHIQTTPLDTSTTTALPTAIYLMPANTMSANGDILIMDYFGRSFNNATLPTLTLNILGQNIVYTMASGSLAWRMKATIIRSTSAIAYYNVLWQEVGDYQYINQGSIGSIDWGIIQTMQLTIQAPTDGNIGTTAGYTQLIKS